MRGDFDGDRVQDVAILIKEKSSGKFGIMVIHTANLDYYILGAGKSIGSGGDNFTWLGVWFVSDKKEEANQKGEGILVFKPESAGGLLYWTGQEYVWKQRGD